MNVAAAKCGIFPPLADYQHLTKIHFINVFPVCGRTPALQGRTVPPAAVLKIRCANFRATVHGASQRQNSRYNVLIINVLRVSNVGANCNSPLFNCTHWIEWVGGWGQTIIAIGDYTLHHVDNQLVTTTKICNDVRCSCTLSSKLTFCGGNLLIINQLCACDDSAGGRNKYSLLYFVRLGAKPQLSTIIASGDYTLHHVDNQHVTT